MIILETIAPISNEIIMAFWILTGLIFFGLIISLIRKKYNLSWFLFMTILLSLTLLQDMSITNERFIAKVSNPSILAYSIFSDYTVIDDSEYPLLILERRK